MDKADTHATFCSQLCPENLMSFRDSWGLPTIFPYASQDGRTQSPGASQQRPSSEIWFSY